MKNAQLLPVIALAFTSVIGCRAVYGMASLRPEATEYTSAEQLLEGMPSEKYPKSGPAAAPELRAANGWLRENVVGKAVKWTGTLELVRLAEADGDRYKVMLTLRWTSTFRGAHPNGNPSFGQVRLGQEYANAALVSPHYRQEHSPDFITISPWSRESLTIAAVDEQLAKQLRDLPEGKPVTIRATVTGAEFIDQPGEPYQPARLGAPRPSPKARLTLWIRVRPTSIEGLKLPQDPQQNDNPLPDKGSAQTGGPGVGGSIYDPRRTTLILESKTDAPTYTPWIVAGVLLAIAVLGAAAVLLRSRTKTGADQVVPPDRPRQ